MVVMVCVTHFQVSSFLAVWVIGQTVLYGCSCEEILKVSLRIVMTLWGLYGFLDGSASFEQLVYVLFNLNEFWTIVPVICMAVFSMGLIVCFSFSICFLKASQFLSKQAIRFYERLKYHRQIQQLCYSNLSEHDNIECSICLDNGGPVCTQECGHQYHPVCIKQWLDFHHTCPVCRKQLY